MPDQKAKAILNDIGTEQLAQLENVGTIVHQLTEGCSAKDMKNAGVGAYILKIIYRKYIIIIK